MGSNLALNILCAVANPLGAEGMLRIVRGALESRDLRKDLPSVGLPLVIIQVCGALTRFEHHEKRRDLKGG